MKKNLCPYQILIVITDCEKWMEETVLNILNRYLTDKAIVSRAKGTAPSTMSEIFGFGTSEKSITSAIIESKNSNEIVGKLTDTLKFNETNNGIVFTLPITSMDSRIFYLMEEKK